ncbi:GNA1162 family protein [Porphyromonas gulae]|uniref:Bacterial lipoprotein n=1 Tax=Porphyromonas gulae TaxID=111105 RepID=A0A0A2FRH6_9PORP|nr:GNA1162 family protein [Porphyromonas gulae]KGN92635.1 bacterial lipoprotein [Porphyromonas gulae]
MRMPIRAAFSRTIALCALLSLSMAGSGYAQESIKKVVYSKMYEESPVAILIMPPINETNHVEAQDYFFSTLTMPLVEKGFYVFSPYLAMELLRQESAGDAEQFLEGNLKRFYDVFQADAVLFTIIKNWSKAALVSTVSVEVEYILRSAKTNEELFRRSADVSVDCSVSSGNGILIDMLANSLATAATDKVVAARKANAFILEDMPHGKYSPKGGRDGADRVGPQHLTEFTVK